MTPENRTGVHPTAAYTMRSVGGPAPATGANGWQSAGTSTIAEERRWRLSRRFSLEVRQASLHGTATQHVELTRLVTAVRQGHIELEHGLQAVLQLRSLQHPR